LKKVF